MMRFNRRMGIPAAMALLGMSVVGTAYAEDAFPLQSIDFVSNNHATEIFLHTGSIVPYRTVLSTDNKIVVDVDRVIAEQTVKTNFTQAENVSNVVLQPLSSRTMRLIIRGDRLGKPSVAFKDVNAHANETLRSREASLPFARSSREETLQDRSPAPVSERLNETSSEASSQTPFEKPITLNPEDVARISDNQGAAEHMSSSESGSGFKPANDMLDNAPAPLALSESSKNGSSSKKQNGKGDSGNFLDQLPGFEGGDIFKFGILGVIILGFGWFIRRKWVNIQRQNAFTDGSASQATQRLKQNSFRDLADAYHLNNPKQGRKSLQKSTYADAPIGLRSFQGGGEEEEWIDDGPAIEQHRRQAVQETRVNLPQLAPQKPSTPPPKQQAINQYAKQSKTPPVNNANQARQRVSDDVLRQELQRGQEVRRQAEQMRPTAPRRDSNPMASALVRKAAATAPKRPAGTQNNPLPPNPEVLNFLRSVADLMENDGKPSYKGNPQRRPT